MPPVELLPSFAEVPPVDGAPPVPSAPPDAVMEVSEGNRYSGNLFASSTYFRAARRTPPSSRSGERAPRSTVG